MNNVGRSCSRMELLVYGFRCRWNTRNDYMHRTATFATGETYGHAEHRAMIRNMIRAIREERNCV